MTAIQYAILREAERLRKFPEARYKNWEVITEIADHLFDHPGADQPRHIPETSYERNRRRQKTAEEESLTSAMMKLRAHGYRVSPPKSDEELDREAAER